MWRNRRRRKVTRLTPAPDVSAADWIVEALQTFGESVLSLVPAGFAAYVRVFHPAWQLDDDGYPTISVPWADVARANGTRANPAMQFRTVMSAPTFEHNIDPQPGVFDAAPQSGSLPADAVDALVRVLAQHTTTPELCSFAIWEGWGALRADIRSAPSFHLPARDYHLLFGPFRAATESALDVPSADQSPSLWWPQDRAWLVATEIDLDSTYIGCTETCADAIFAVPGLESSKVEPSCRIDWYSDPLNPSPAE